MKHYVIANYSVDPNKMDVYATYPQEAGKTVFQYGGRILVASRDSRTIEGNPEQVTVVLEFDSQADADRWYNSEEYQAIKDLRIKPMTDGWLVGVDEFQMP